jgi:hypothetical protein
VTCGSHRFPVVGRRRGSSCCQSGSNSPKEGLARVFDLGRRNRWKLRISSAAERITRLRRLRESIEAHADEVNAMLRTDLFRPPESPVSLEVPVVLADLDATIAALPDWTEPVAVQPMGLLPGADQVVPYVTEFVRYESRGVTPIFGSWNTPFLLLLQPLIAAIAGARRRGVASRLPTPPCKGLNNWADGWGPGFSGGARRACSLLGARAAGGRCDRGRCRVSRPSCGAWTARRCARSAPGAPWPGGGRRC